MSVRMIRAISVSCLVLVAAVTFAINVQSQIAKFTASDPGVRAGSNGAGGMLPGLSSLEQRVFGTGKEAFQQVASVQGTIPDTEAGLGPRFNLDSCAGCHAFPVVGGSSPAINPQLDMAKKAGATNTTPSFIQKDGPIREARFKFNPDGSPDGGVHALFTITGRSDAPGCFLISNRRRRAECSLPDSHACLWSRFDRGHR